MNERMTTELVVRALNQAITHRRPGEGLIHHSDKGCQYTSHTFQNELIANNIQKNEDFKREMGRIKNTKDGSKNKTFRHY